MRFLASLFSVLALVVALPVMAANAPDARVANLMEQVKTLANVVKWEVDKDQDFQLLVNLDGRTQVVYINSATEKWPDDGSPEFIEIREVWGPAFPSKGAYFPKKTANMLLQNSQNKKLGAWQAYPADNKWFAVFNVKIGAESDASSLASIVKYVALAADNMEYMMTGGRDDF